MPSESRERFYSLLNEVLPRTKELGEALKSGIDSDSRTDDHTKKVQNRSVRLLEINHKGWLMSHPTVARQAVNKILGETRANAYRRKMDECNLTTNCQPDSVDSILRKGNTAGTLVSYAKNNMQPDDVQKLNEILSSGKTNKQMLNEFNMAMNAAPNKTSRKNWVSIIDRASAELFRVGVTVNEQKPVYIAFNPDGSKEGSCPFYGEAHVIANDDILPHCTACINDSFDEDSYNAPKVHDMEHLKDMFLLRQIHGGRIEKNDWIDREYDSDVRMELHYHKPVLGKNQMRLGAREME
jgi:hypothetical protein